MPNTNEPVSTPEANQNLSDQIDQVQEASNEEVLQISARLIEQNHIAYEELGK